MGALSLAWEERQGNSEMVYLFVYFSHKQCELFLEDALVVISVITAESPYCETRVISFLVPISF